VLKENGLHPIEGLFDYHKLTRIHKQINKENLTEKLEFESGKKRKIAVSI